MIRRKLQDLTLCITYNINFLHDKAHGAKSFRKQYSVSEEIGRGGFGVVYKAERTFDGAPVAVKFVEHKRVREWTMTCKQLLPTEICLLELCAGTPGVVRLVDWFASSKGFLIVMDRPEDSMDLFDIISAYGRLDEFLARFIFSQLVNAVCCLYANYGILHRDIKDENIVINMQTGEVILVDFGAAALISNNDVKDFQGTRSYCPPEWFKRLVYKPIEAAVWSLGIVLFLMVTGHMPFRNEMQICLGRLSLPKKLSKGCQDLIRRCLCVIAERRADLIEVKKHPWLQIPVGMHSVTFKSLLDRKLNQRISAKRKARQRVMSNDDVNTPTSDSPTDAETDVCDRMRRASSADEIAADADDEMTPVLRRRIVDTNNDEPMGGYFLNRNTALAKNAVEKVQKGNKANDRSEEELLNEVRIRKTPMRDCKEISSTQFYTASESLDVLLSEAQTSETCSTADEDSRYFDAESLQCSTVLDFDISAASASASYCSASWLSKKHSQMYHKSGCKESILNTRHRDKLLSANSSTEIRRKSNITRVVSRQRPLTVVRYEVANSSKPPSTFRTDSQKPSP